MNNKLYVYDKSNSKIFNIFEYIFAFLTVIENSIFVSSGKIGLFIKLIWTFILILFFIYSFINLKSNIFNKIFIFIFIFISIISLFLICNYFVYPFNRKYIFALLVAPVMLMIYFTYCSQSRVEYPDIFYKFENVMLIISIISLLFWFISLIGISTNMSIMSKFGANFDGTSVVRSIPGYFDIYFIPQGSTPFLGMNFIRNSSIFNEAPIYSAMLNIALFIELFFRKKYKFINYRIIILLITLISTTSTNGILISIFALLLYLYLSIDKNKKITIILTLIPIIVPIIFFVIKSIFSDKINTGFNSSYALRIDDVYSALYAWTNHLFIGNGLGNGMSIIQHIESWRWLVQGGTGISPGLTTELAYGGILLILIYLLPIFLASKKSKNIFVCSICLILLFIVEDISSYYIFIMLISYFWIYYLIHK